MNSATVREIGHNFKDVEKYIFAISANDYEIFDAQPYDCLSQIMLKITNIRSELQSLIEEPWKFVGTDRYIQEGAVVLAKKLLGEAEKER